MSGTRKGIPHLGRAEEATAKSCICGREIGPKDEYIIMVLVRPLKPLHGDSVRLALSHSGDPHLKEFLADGLLDLLNEWTT